MSEKITAQEFACKGKNCCCGDIKVDLHFLAQLRRAREFSTTPFVITSGYRCPKHNESVGSTSVNHVLGRAADIRTRNNQERDDILQALYKAGFRRVGIHEDFIHVDNMDQYKDTGAVRSCWLY